ncbi:Jerky -like [Araneus ventricosus]|uniref:Jerky-like n=1 Tax=Araneus ventricosus TaxID=182803 RepID=A0A4Y2VVL1_ARAVE|nr:Jerky -like [Araneus ventricosus]
MGISLWNICQGMRQLTSNIWIRIRNFKTIYRRNLLLKLVEEAYDDLRSVWKNLTVLDVIYYFGVAWKLVKSSTVKKSWRAILSDKENGIPTDDDDSAHLHRKILEDLRKLDCSENVDEEAVEQWINEDSTLECCEVLSDVVIVSRATCGSEETRNFEECPESDDENLVTHHKLSHGDALVHTEVLLDYLEQEDESTPAGKMY